MQENLVIYHFNLIYTHFLIHLLNHYLVYILLFIYILDLMALKAKLQTLLNIMEQKEKEFHATTQTLKEQLTTQEADYKTQIRNLKSAQQVEVDRLQSVVYQIEAKNFQEGQEWQEEEAGYKSREVVSREFIQSLQNDVHELRQVFLYTFKYI